MDSSNGKPEVHDSSRQSRSLDFKRNCDERWRASIGNSRAHNQGSVLKRKSGPLFVSRMFGFAELSKKRSGAELYASSFDHIVKRRRNVPSRPKQDGFGSGIRKPKNSSSLIGTSHDLHDSSRLSDSLHVSGCILALPPDPPPPNKEGDQPPSVGNLESVDGLEFAAAVPKRPRGVSRRKISENSISSNIATSASSCSGKDHVDGQTIKLAANLVPPSPASNNKQNKGYDEFKVNSSSRDNSDHYIKGTHDTSGQVRRRKVRSRKPQISAVEIQKHRENRAHLVEDDQKSFEELFDGDEENLEENAAIMLLSRFDPRCTGLSRKRMSSSKSANEPSSQPFQKTSKVSGSEVSSVHAEGRALRPRKNNGRGFVRKRRHFYEVRYSDMDPYWVVKQRIRVFWPLDQSWYFGLVKDYDPVTKLHYVKYDDRDEEWINLQNERFKLLLFPSEVKFNSERLRSRVKKNNEEGNKNSMDENRMGSIVESETIISWLARLNRPLKSSQISLQKQRRIHVLEEFESPILSASKGSMSMAPPSMAKNKLSSSYVVPERLTEGEITRARKREGTTNSGNRKLSFVYFRKRFRRKEGLVVKPDGDSACATSTEPISLLASVADREAALEELHVNVTPRKLKQITFKLSLPPQCSHHLAFGAEWFLLCSTLLLHHGKLTLLWPRVHMEIVFVDAGRGLRLLSFEGCLRWAVALVCLIMATFYQNKTRIKLSEIHAPYTSVGFNLSGLHARRAKFLFALYSFVELENPKYRYLENELKKLCITTWELPIEDCTFLNIKNILSRTNKILHTSIFEYPLPLEGFPKKSFSDIMHQQILNNLSSSNMNPGVCYCDNDCGVLPPSVISFSPAPLFFLSMHLKLLMENMTAALGSQKRNSTPSRSCPENYAKLTGEGYSPVEDSSDQVSETTNENFGSAAASSEWLKLGHIKVDTDALSLSNDGEWERSSHDLSNGEINMSRNRVGWHDLGKKSSDETFVQSHKFLHHTKSWQGVEKPCSVFDEGSFYLDKSETGCRSSPLFTHVEERLCDRGQRAAHSASDLVWEMNERAICSPNITTPRSTWHRNRCCSVSPTFGQCSKLLPEDFAQNGFVNASRKPRTQVSYSLHVGDCDIGSKHPSYRKKERFYKKIKTDNAKKISGGPESPEGYWESLTCYADVLVTVGDRGWRECGAQVVLESDDQKDWNLSVKFSGTTKYMHKAHQFLQPGTTNRYTHAMMWKGGNNWILEFNDRSQWSHFKVIYEECFNRNIRAASVKNIPIPGVRLIDDGDEEIVEVPFIRSSSKYHHQVGSEVDMALDPSHVSYDMDSSDEEWISNLKNSSDHKSSKMAELTDDMYERVMDMFEKVAYAEQCNRFSNNEIEEFMADFGPLDIIRVIYEHWQQKRQKKGLPLIRQFQPPLWEHYQKQLKEWGLVMSKIQSSSDGCPEKSYLLEKPPMFAFCLRPRGLEVPNKSSKQKSHRKFMFTGYHNSFAREQDGLHAYGRKLNGVPVGEKSSFAVSNHEFSYSQWLQSPSDVLPKDAVRTGVLTMTNDGSERSRHPKHYRSNSKKNVMSLSPRDARMSPFTYNERSKRNGVHCWGTDICNWPNRTKQSKPDGFQGHQADINEFMLRDASNAAQHASNMAKLKREKAQWLLHTADLALHKAMVALMIAEAIKASSQKDLIGDG